MTLATATTTIRGQNVRSAIAGEFFVAGELTKRGRIATLTSKNTAGVDILANQEDRFIRIDVKTRTSGYRGGWQVGHVRISDPGDFIVLVDLGYEDEPPEYWIVAARTAQNLLVRSGGRVLIRAGDVEQFDDAWGLLDS
jgi:hypothetical protein